MCLYTCGDLIASVPFFEDAEEGFTTSVVTLLRPAVFLLSILPLKSLARFFAHLLAFTERLIWSPCKCVVTGVPEG